MREEQIADFFGQLGPIKKSKKRGKEGDPTIHLYMDKRTQRPKGDCTVSFDESETAKAAIKWYDGKCFGVSRHPHRAAARAFFFPAVALPRSPRPLTAQNLTHTALRLQPYSYPSPHPTPPELHQHEAVHLDRQATRRRGLRQGGGQGRGQGLLSW